MAKVKKVSHGLFRYEDRNSGSVGGMNISSSYEQGSFFIALLRRICLALGRQTILLRGDQDQPPRPSTYLQCKQIKESSTVPVYDHLHLQYMQ